MNYAKLCLLLAALLFASCTAPRTVKRQGNGAATPAAAPDYEPKPPLATFNGRVVSIDDGDTIIVLDSSNRSYKIRLAGIDAPEGGQAFGNRSKENLAREVFGRDVTIEWAKRDRYRRIVGKVLLDGRDVCLEQVKAGMAWHYKYYQAEQSVADRKLYAEAEDEARAARRGLWVDVDPTPPWDFRRGK